jgi:PKD repeat protein
MKNNIKKSILVACLGFAVLSTVLFYSCQKETTYSLSSELPSASFTLTPVAGANNTYQAINTSTGYFAAEYDKGDGSSVIVGKDTTLIKYTKKGTFNLKLIVVGQGGKAEAVKEVVSAK